MSAAAGEAIRRIVGLGAEADETLRAVVAELARQPGVDWAGVLFLEEGTLTLGPEAGLENPSRRVSAAVRYEDVIVGELAVDGDIDVRMLEEVSSLLSTHVLLGWDTGGEPWEP